MTLPSFLSDTLGFNIVSLSVTIIVTILISFFFYCLSRRIRLPNYAIRTVNIIKEKAKKINGIQVTYREAPIENFSISRIALWNNGKETINRADVASSDKLRIESLGEVKLLDAQIIYEKNTVNKFSLNLDEIQNQRILINFDYFDFSEGIILQVFHTGETGEEIEIRGTIKGAGAIKRNGLGVISKIIQPFDLIEKLKRKHRKLFAGLLLIITPFIFIASEFAPKPEIKNIFLLKYLPVIVITALYWSMAYVSLRRRAPKGFELFEEEIEIKQ